MSYRIIRGFSRLGIGAAVLVAFCGVGLTAILAIDGYSRATHPRGLSDMDVGLAPPFDPTKPYEYEVDGKWWRYDPVTGYAPIPARESNPPPPGFVIDRPRRPPSLQPNPPASASA